MAWIGVYEQAFYAAHSLGHRRIMRALVEDGGVDAGSLPGMGSSAHDHSYSRLNGPPARNCRPVASTQHARVDTLIGECYCCNAHGPVSKPEFEVGVWCRTCLADDADDAVGGHQGRVEAYFSAFCRAADAGHTKIMRALLSREGGLTVDSCSRTGWTPLANAAWLGLIQAARMLVTAWGADVNLEVTVEDESLTGATPLFIAARAGDTELARVLLQYKADFDKKTAGSNLTPLYITALKGHTETARLLVECKADVNGTAGDGDCAPLCISAWNGHTELARMLVLEANANVNQMMANDGPTPLIFAAQEGHAELARMLVVEGDADVDQARADDGTGTTPLHISARRGHTEVVRMLVIEGKADVNKGSTDRSSTPLIIAARNGHTEVARVLVVEGNANVDLAETVGPTALYVASRNGHLEIVCMLMIEGNAEVNKASDTDSSTPLFIAAFRGHADVASLLVIEGKADVHKTRDDGTTCLFVAAQNGHLDLAYMLLQAKADVNQAEGDYGGTPLYIAAYLGHAEMVRMLVLQGKARINQQTQSGVKPLLAAACNGHHEACFTLCVLGADIDLFVPETEPERVFTDQALVDWLKYARGPPCGSPLKIALERRDHVSAVRMLQAQRTETPTPRLIREELMPVVVTMGGHPLALPVCERTRRVAEMALELHSNRWSTKLNALCGDKQRQTVMVVMMIMLRAARGRSVRSQQRGRVQTRRMKQEQWVGLPGWMYGVPDDVWWKVMEMMGLW